MPSHSLKRGFQLTEGDVEILTHVYQLRLSTIDHLVALTGRPRFALNRRLLKLTENKYLYCKRRRFEKYVYTINRAAGSILVERGIASPEVVNLRVRLHELTDLFLSHALMLTDIHVVLKLVSRESPIKLVEWREGKELYESVTVYEAGERVKLPVRPDAFFTLQDTRREGYDLMGFFLEADRSTTTNKRFQKKIKGYSAYFEQGRYTEKYGFKGARVVTVTLTEARAVNLCAASREVLPSGNARFYYFTSTKHFSFENPAQILDAIFISPKDFDTDMRYSLTPPLPSSG